MDFKKEPWTDDLNEFLSFLNPKAKSYEDVKKALEIAWPQAFKRYANMLIIKDDSEAQDLVKQVEKSLDWEADFNQWLSIKYPESECIPNMAREAWEEAYNVYVRYGQTQAQMDQFVENAKKEE